MGQNTSNSVWKPCEDLQKTFDLCHCQQRVYNKVLRWNFVIDQILIFHHNLQINSLKILQCDFLEFLFLILSLVVEVYLWWKLQASLIFLSGRTCIIGGWLNTFLPHCMSTLQSMVGLYIWHLFFSVFNLISPSVHFYHFKVPHLKQYCSKPVMHMNYTCGGGCFVPGWGFIF